MRLICESCDHEELAHRAAWRFKKDHVCPECGGKMEFDEQSRREYRSRVREGLDMKGEE